VSISGASNPAQSTLLSLPHLLREDGGFSENFDEAAIFLDVADLKFKQRAPSNGAITEIGTGADGGGGITPVANATALEAIPIPKGWRFLQSPFKTLVYWDELSTKTRDGITVWKPTFIDAANPGRWIAYVPPTYNNVVTQAGDVVTHKGEVVTGNSEPNVLPTYLALSNETYALLNRLSGTYTDTQKLTIDALISGLVQDGIWALLDCLQIYKAQNLTDALTNWVKSAHQGANVGATFAAYDGITTNSSNSAYINSNFIPANGVNFTKNAGSIGVWQATPGTASVDVGAGGNSTAPTTVAHYSSAGALLGINALQTQISIADSGAAGLLVGTRISSSQISGYKNGALKGTINSTVSSNPLGTLPLFVGGYNNAGAFASGSSRKYQVFVVGGLLNDAQNLSLYNRLATFLSSFTA
jgi:hypothetical protein